MADWAKWNCERKIVYTSMAAAKRAVKRTSKQSTYLNAYKCHVCDGFHIGNTPKRMRGYDG